MDGTKIKEIVRKYWWVALVVILTWGAVSLWRTEQAIKPSPTVQEVTDRAISSTEEIDRQLEILQNRVSEAEREVRSHAWKATAEVADLDCQALAARWNRIVADERARRSGVSADATSPDWGGWGLGE
ncbi:hypothetical protein L2W58_02035 [Dethiosulfovibrio sp. F2B]|uniref:hypothetical protein n=1 Tax=Dethiosulfovibrio faecalis TaxID=2720018 RepID=UPI001F3CE8FA|nr:hypothetical protein [Dethiosulfovibrio faecalis]MCF4150572.1 hypothetical protein [Dethiosulfovibrio faecalis]